MTTEDNEKEIIRLLKEISRKLDQTNKSLNDIFWSRS